MGQWFTLFGGVLPYGNSRQQPAVTKHSPCASHLVYSHSTGFVQQPCEPRILFPISRAGTLMFREAKCLTSSHTAGHWQSWDSNTGPCAMQAWAVSTMLCGFL